MEGWAVAISELCAETHTSVGYLLLCLIEVLITVSALLSARASGMQGSAWQLTEHNCAGVLPPCGVQLHTVCGKCTRQSTMRLSLAACLQAPCQRLTPYELLLQFLRLWYTEPAPVQPRGQLALICKQLSERRLIDLNKDDRSTRPDCTSGALLHTLPQTSVVRIMPVDHPWIALTKIAVGRAIVLHYATE